MGNWRSSLLSSTLLRLDISSFISLHDTYYVVAHFHFVLSLGAVLAIITAVTYYTPALVVMESILPSNTSSLSLLHLSLVLCGILLTFTPLHLVGFNVMPRRISDYPDMFHGWNF